MLTMCFPYLSSIDHNSFHHTYGKSCGKSPCVVIVTIDIALLKKLITV